MNPWLEEKIRQGFEPNTEAPVGSPENPSNRILTLANVITLTRFVLTIVFLVLFVSRTNRALSIAIYAVAASTDWMDGQIARRTQTVSWFGKLVDPICDRALLFTGVIGLVATGELPLWVAVLVIFRDVYLAVGMVIVRHFRERPIDVVYVGKVATALLMTGFCLLLLGVPTIAGLGLTSAGWLPVLNAEAGPAGLLFVYAGCVFSVITAVAYSVEGISICRACASRARDEAAAHEAEAR